MRVPANVVMVVFENPADEFVFVVVYRFDDEPVVTREIKERAGLSGGTKFGENVLFRQRQEVVGGVELEALFPQISEDPGRIVLEFEIILD